MLKRLLLLSASLFMLWQAQAQTAREEIAATPAKSGGVYYAYPGPTSQQTAAPKGYKPFYISHYGRHGSRYMLSDNDYKRPLDMFKRYHDEGVLSAKGEEVYVRLQEIWKEAENHGDELAPLGKRQHRGIAERMYRSFPQVFAQKKTITARSTTSMRVALSMCAFVERLKELNANLDIDWETSKANMSYLNWHSEAYNEQKKDPEGWQKQFRAFSMRPQDNKRFLSQLFKDEEYIEKNMRMLGFVKSKLFEVAIDLQDMETDVDLFDLFTADELFESWQGGNMWFYGSDGPCPLNKGQALESCKPLLRNFLESAQKAVAGDGDAATLRFGHDGNIIPLAAILKLEGCDKEEAECAEVWKVWQNYHVSPMGANIQIVFFKNKKNDVIVKFMLNENEVSIPIETDIAPYYHWKDVEKLWQEILR